MAGSNDHSIALRVLSGSAAGAEVPLVPGQRYSVGIDDEVDFIIDDPGIAGHHANLELDAGIVRMTPVESAAIELDGESFEGGIVPLYTAVQLGRTILAFGEEGENWPRIMLPDNGSGFIREIVDDGDEPPVDAAKAASRQESASGHLVQRFVGAIGILLLLLLMVLPTAWGVRQAFRERSQERLAVSGLEDPVIVRGRLLQSVLTPEPGSRPDNWDEAWSQLRLSREGDTWIFFGYLDRFSQLNALRKAVSDILSDSEVESAGAVIWEVRVNQILMGNLRKLISRYGLDVKAESIGEGRYSISGKIASNVNWSEAWAQLQQAVKFEIKGISELVDRTDHADASSDPDGQEMAEGSTTGGKEPELFPLPVRSISIGRSSCITLVSGERLFAGAELPNGYRIRAIEPGRITVQQGDRRIFLQIPATDRE